MVGGMFFSRNFWVVSMGSAKTDSISGICSGGGIGGGGGWAPGWRRSDSSLIVSGLSAGFFSRHFITADSTCAGMLFVMPNSFSRVERLVAGSCCTCWCISPLKNGG